jgi:hypothetical protein
VDFSVYDRSSGVDSYLNTLGPLETPRQRSARGINAGDPRTALGYTERPDVSPQNFSVFHGKTGSD